MTSLELRSNSQVITIGGKAYKLDFDMLTMSHAEAVYASQFGMNANVQIIMADAIYQKSVAVMAMGYGALCSAGYKISWKTFAKDMYTWQTLEAWNDVVADGIAGMMPEPVESEDNGEETEKK